MNPPPERWTEDLLTAYVDGECTEGQRALVEHEVEQSPSLRRVLDEIREARAAVRALPPRNLPPAFWARLVDSGLAPAEGATVVPSATVVEPRRPARRARRWLVAASGAAAAAVVAAVLLVPQEHTVTPPVASFTDAHAVRSSLDSDAVSSLAPIGLRAGFRR